MCSLVLVYHTLTQNWNTAGTEVQWVYRAVLPLQEPKGTLCCSFSLFTISVVKPSSHYFLIHIQKILARIERISMSPQMM